MGQAMAGIFEYWEKRNSAGEIVDSGSRFVRKTELSLTVADLTRVRGWRQAVMKQLEAEGVKVLAVNVLAEKAHDCDVAVTVTQAQRQRLPERKKPVIRGGRPVGEPTKAKTMAAKRRDR